ncbi:hypothetical protein FRAHR75_440018 [Frankia sp. Hr75.2]|nr:hypothetical protein FRAHR75_440018 [Frankia sp. Hr75.2]
MPGDCSGNGGQERAAAAARERTGETRGAEIRGTGNVARAGGAGGGAGEGSSADTEIWSTQR